MRYARTFIFSQVLVLSLAASAQSGDWEVVKHIAGGSTISVRTEHRLLKTRCYLLGVTDTQLTCQLEHAPLWLSVERSKIIYDRSRVSKLWVEHSDAENRATTGLIGAAAGAGLGAANAPRGTRVAGAVLGGSIAGLVGYFWGDVFHPLPGRLVYKR